MSDRRAAQLLQAEIDLERIVLGGTLCYGFDPLAPVPLRADDFIAAGHAELWTWLGRNRDKWTPGVDNLLAHQTALVRAGLADKLGDNPATAVIDLVTAVGGVGASGVAHYAGELFLASLKRHRRDTAARFADGRLSEGEFAAINRELDARAAEFATGATGGEKLLAALDARRFNHSEPPVRPVPIFMIGDNVISTAGNLTVLAAQAKAGKSAFLGAMLAAALNSKTEEGATLGVRSPGAGGRAVLHFDTEQSRFDHDALVRLALKRAGLSDPPACLRSYCLTDASVADRLAMMRLEIARAGNVFAVFLDGVADFVHDPNDPAEAFAFVGELHRLAIEADCVIVAVLHENPGSADFGKTRGHLGSQLERKAETNLRLSKSEGVTTVWTDRGARHCDIPKTAGIRFEYSTLEGCHCLLDSANDARAQAAKDELTAFAASVFQGQAAGLSWSELRNRIMLLSGVKESGARARLQKMAEAGLIRKNLLHQWESAL